MHKVMALDVGTKRIGIALSDYLQVIATPHSFISRVPEEKAIEEIIKIAKENRVEKIVVGVPINMDGTFGGQAKDCQDFSQKNPSDYFRTDDLNLFAAAAAAIAAILIMMRSLGNFLNYQKPLIHKIEISSHRTAAGHILVDLIVGNQLDQLFIQFL